MSKSKKQKKKKQAHTIPESLHIARRDPGEPLRTNYLLPASERGQSAPRPRMLATKVRRRLRISQTCGVAENGRITISGAQFYPRGVYGTSSGHTWEDIFDHIHAKEIEMDMRQDDRDTSRDAAAARTVRKPHRQSA